MSSQGSIGRNLPGNSVQVVSTSTGAAASTFVVLPFDDTIPQQTEGVEFITLAITPTESTNLLLIDFTSFAAADSAGQAITGIALFQDATANALAAVTADVAPNVQPDINTVQLRHIMTAGTTSSTTFKIRFGTRAVTDTATINADAAGSRRYGGVAATVFTITEIEV